MNKKATFISMRSKLIWAMTLALLLAAAVFVCLREVGNFLVWRYYLDESTSQERAVKYADQFQDYVANNKLSIEDTDKISKWSAGKYVDIIVYKDTNLIYAPDWFIGYDENGKDHEGESETFDPSYDDQGLKSPADIIKDSEFYESWFSGDRGFEKYLTEEARKQYSDTLDSILEGNSDLLPVYFVDGTLLIRIVDYSEDFLYNIVFVISIAGALLIIALIMFLVFSKMARRINRLATNVRLVEDGDLDMPISVDGNDEIAVLADDVNSMRNTIIDNMTKERQVWEANAGLVTAMSHDIRTPLTVMMGYLDLAEMQNTDESTKEYLSACKENAMRLKQLSDDMFSYMLVFGKTNMELKIKAMSASDFLSHHIAEHTLLLEESGYNITNEGSIPDHKILIDPIYFGRVIDNIFSNITKYADIESPVIISFEQYGEFLSMQFKNKTRTDKSIPDSNGIGLRSCAKIMEQMGGSMSSHDNEQGDGMFVTVLKIRLEEAGSDSISDT